LDITRKFIALQGEQVFDQVLRLTKYAREEISSIEGDYAIDEDMVNHDSVFALDPTKLTIHTRGIGLAGTEIYDILRDEYDIQVELGDLGNILAIIGIGDSKAQIERLISALQDIKDSYETDDKSMIPFDYINPVVKVSPQTAYYSKMSPVLITEALNKISGESIMVYPPGIPIIAPGEEITQVAIDYILYAKEVGSFLTGIEDTNIEYINVLEV
jgi:lysine decarboxylase